MTLGIPIWALFESFLQLVFSIYSSKTRALPVWLERVLYTRIEEILCRPFICVLRRFL